MPDPDPLDAKIESILQQKLDSALAPILKKLDALKPEEEENPDPPAEDPKLDAFQLAEATLRTKLDGFVPAEKLKAMKMVELSQTLASLQSAIQNPDGGILNPIHTNPKKDSADLFADTDPNKIVWE